MLSSKPLYIVPIDYLACSQMNSITYAQSFSECIFCVLCNGVVYRFGTSE